MATGYTRQIHPKEEEKKKDKVGRINAPNLNKRLNKSRGSPNTNPANIRATNHELTNQFESQLNQKQFLVNFKNIPIILFNGLYLCTTQKTINRKGALQTDHRENKQIPTNWDKTGQMKSDKGTKKNQPLPQIRHRRVGWIEDTQNKQIIYS